MLLQLSNYLALYLRWQICFEKRGPRVDTVASRAPFEFLKLFWTDEVMEQFVTNTNLYAANNNDKDWKYTNIDDLWVFFAVVLFLGMFMVLVRVISGMRRRIFAAATFKSGCLCSDSKLFCTICIGKAFINI